MAMDDDLLPELPDVTGWKNSQDLLPDIPDVSNKKYADASFLDKLPANIAAGLGQLGHNILKESHREWQAVAPAIAKYIPQQPEYNYSDMLGLPGTRADQLVQGLVKNAPLMLGPQGEAGLISKGIGYIPQVGKYLAGPAERIASQGMIGAFSGDDPSQESKKAAAIQAAFEALPLPFKGAKKLAETINPVEYAGKTLEKIRNGLSLSEKAEKEAYEPFNKLSGTYKFKEPQNYNQVYADVKDYYTPYIKRLDQKFQEKPTLENAHKLQSQMYTDIKKLSKGEGQGVLDKIQGIESARNALNKDVHSALKFIDKGIAKSYKEGGRIHREEIMPHYSNPDLAKLITGEIDKLNPNRLKKALNTAKESNKLPDSHYLRQALEDITSKVNKGKALQYGLPAIAGAALSQVGHHGMLPLGLGVGLGGYAGHGAKKVAELIQNPEVANVLAKIGKGLRYAQPLVRGLLD